MENGQGLPELIVSGMSTSSGGSYSRVRVDGMAKVNGDLECKAIDISGSMKLKGRLDAERIQISGMGTVEGPVNCTTIRIDGMGSLLKGINAEDYEVNGRGKVIGKLNAEKVKVGGSLKVEGNVECENFAADGMVNIDGLLNAEVVEIYLNGSSDVHEIGGERINIRRGQVVGGFLKTLGLGSAPRMKCRVIEGDDVYLEDTHADIVRGGTVMIGKGCQIRQVEYTKSCEVDPSAKVGSKHQA